MSKTRWEKSVWGSLFTRLSRSVGLRRNSRRRSQRQRLDSMASAECLETRLTPASATFAGGLLTISGTAAGDDVLVAEGPSSTRVSINNVLLATISGASTSTISTITFNGTGAAQQTLTITGNGPALNTINYTTGTNFQLVVKANATPAGGTLAVDAGGATLDFGITNVVGNLTVTNVGAVTDSGRVSVSGTATITTNTPAADDITLDGPTGLTNVNSFGSLVLTGNDITIREAGDTDLGNTTATGLLSVTSTGSVTDSGAAGISANTASGGTTITATNRGLITLDAAGAATNTFGVLTLNGGSITIVEDAATDLGVVTASLGDLDVTSTGAINDGGAISVLNGRATFNAGGGGIIDLSDFGHRFKSVSAVTTGNVEINEADSTELFTTTVGGNLIVTSAGAITDVGSVLTAPGTQNHSIILVTGSTSLTAGGATPVIILDSALNNFDVGGSGDNVVFTGSNVTLVDVDAIEFGASTATGALTVTAGGAVTDDGAMTISGKATIRAVGSDITLNESTFGSLSLYGANVSITEGAGGSFAGTDLVASAITGTLTVSTTGNITNGANLGPGANVPNYSTLEVTGATSLTATGDITVTSAGPVLSSFGTLTLSGVNINITEHNATNLGDVIATGNFTLFVRDGAQGAAPLGGGVTQVGGSTFSVTGLATIDAIAKYDIDLTTGTNNFGSLIFSGRDVSITEASATVLGERLSTTSTQGSTAYRDLHLTSAGSITQTAFTVTQRFGKLTVLGTADIESGATTDITLNRVDPTSTLSGAPTANANQFGRLELTTTGVGADATILEFGPSDLGTTNITGDLSVTSTGPITDSGILTVAGATSLTAGANTIILDQNTGAFVPVPQNNLQGAISLSGTNLVLQNAAAGGTVLGTVTATGTLSVSSTTAISNPLLAISVGGKATFTTTAGGTAADPVDLGTTLDANFGSLSVVGATNLTVDEGSATVLDAITITGNLDVDSTGNVTDNGRILVTGSTTIASGGVIALDTPANDFDVGGSGDNFTFTAPGNVTVVDAATGIDFGTSSGLTLTVRASGGDVTDDGDLTIGGGTGAVNVTALGNDIVLNGANSYGPLTLKGATATINDIGVLTLGPSTIQLNNAPGALTLTATGAAGVGINQTGPVLAGGTSITAGANSVTLTNAGNRLGAVTTVSASSLSLTENDAVVLGATNVAGSLTVSAKGSITQTGAIDANATSLNATTTKPITLTNAANSFGTLTMTGSTIAITEDNNTTNGGAAGTDLGTTTATQTLTVNSSGTVSTSGTLTVQGRATVNGTATFAVTLGSGTSSFGSVSVVGSTTGNVIITEGNATDLFTVTTTTGTLSVTSAGAITDSGVVTVGGNATLVAGLTGTAAITLDSAGNDFDALVDFDGTNVTLRDVDAIDFDDSEASGTLTVTAGGAVTQSGGILLIGGTTTINAAGITLSDSANTFGTLLLTSAGNVDIEDSGPADLGASTITGTLILTSGGDITQSGSVTVTGATTFDADTGTDDDVTLTNTNNSFGALTIDGEDVAIREADEIVVTTIEALGTLSLVSTVSPLATTAISQTGVITSTGATTLTATGTNKEINLPLAANTFGSLTITGSNVTIGEDGGTDVATSNISGTLTINTTSDAITSSGTVKVSGTTTLDTNGGGGAAITFGDTSSTFGTLILDGTTITITDSGAVDLGTTNAIGNLTINAGGAITDSGVITVGGTSSFSAIPTPTSLATITLDSASSYAGAISLAGTNVSITNTAATTTLDNVTATGNLSVTSDGDITNTTGGAISVAGTANLDADTGTANDILLNVGGTTSFATVSFDADDVTLSNEQEGVDFGTSTIDGNLSVTSVTIVFVSVGGNITDSGVLTVAGTTTLVVSDGFAGGGNDFTVILDQATSTFGFGAAGTADFVITAGTISIKDNGSVELGNITAVVGDFTVTSSLAGADSITDVAGAVINVNPGFSTFDAGSGTVNINNGGHQFGPADLSYVGIGSSVTIIP